MKKHFMRSLLFGISVMLLLLPIYGYSNEAPVVTADVQDITSDEGLLVENTGTVSDPDGDPVMLSVSLGTIINNGDGTWYWSYVTPYGWPGAWGVIVTADDGQGGISETWFQFARVPYDAEVLAQIEYSLPWLVAEQKPDGCWNGPYHPEGPQIDEPAACTGFVLTKLCDYAYEHGYASPFDPQYIYSQNVIAGYDYLFSQARTHGPGTGIFIHADLINNHHETYNAAVAMIGIAASLMPDRIIESSNALVDGLTYLQVLNEMVNYFQFSQRANDLYNSYGAWGYFCDPLQEDVYADNSISGYVVLALRYAEAIGCVIPQIIKDRLNVWIDYIQNDVSGGSGYAAPDDGVNMLKTGNLLFEMAFVGDNLEDARVQHALDYIENAWDNPGDDHNWRDWDLQCLYCLMRGFESFSIDFINVDGADRNWFNEFAVQIYFFRAPDPQGFWYFAWYGDRLLNTCWALMVLEKVAPNLPPEITAITLPSEPVSINDQPVNVIVTYTDPDGLETDEYSVTFDYGDMTSETVTVAGFACTSPDHIYENPGVYTVTVTVTDEDGGSDTESTVDYIVIYDASEGFVTGGGWINSPEGAYIANPDLKGIANFTFISRYRIIDSMPAGITRFNMRISNMHFRSSSYDWLVITGHKAMYSGVGTINGNGNFGFQISVIDAALTPSTDVDLFRIRICDKDNNNALVYDNQVGENDPNADPTPAIIIGNIKIFQIVLPKIAVQNDIEVKEIPKNYGLSQNYPNPFNPSTIIPYDLPGASKVEIIIYNMLGQVVERILIKNQPAGKHEYTFNAAELSGGMYFYCIKAQSLDGIETQSFQQIKKMIYLK